MPKHDEQTKPESNDGMELLTAARALQRMLEALRLTADRDTHLERTAENVAEFWAEFLHPSLQTSHRRWFQPFRPPSCPVSSLPLAGCRSIRCAPTI